MAYTLTPSDTLLTPKNATEVMPTDSKYTSPAYTAVADDADPHQLMPVFDCSNIWNIVIHIKNNSATNTLVGMYVQPLGAVDEDWSSLDALTTAQISISGTMNLAAGASAFVYTKLGPMPKYIVITSVSADSDLNTTCQIIGSYL
jgi:hypothetical protein